MKHLFVPRFIVLALFVLAGTCAVAAENLPPVEADVLVVGGTAKGVAAAVAAKAEGADVFLVTPFTYLGEDMAGTLELGLPDGQKPTTALVKKLWAGASDLAAYDYWPDRRCPHPRHIYKNDWWERLSEYGRPPSPSDSVYYDSDVSYKCARARARRGASPARSSTARAPASRSSWRTAASRST